MKKAVGFEEMILHSSGGRRMVPSEKKVAIPANNDISEGEVMKFLM